jgi:uncharacterized membrane protein YidH (DUF202 family)
VTVARLVDDGLQPERTALAWSRTSLGVLANVALLLERWLHAEAGGAVWGGLVVGGLLLAALTGLVGMRRQRRLRRRPLPGRVTPRREVWLVGSAMVVLTGTAAVLLLR